MQDQRSQEGNPYRDAVQAMQVLYWFCSMWAASVEVVLRHSFGQRYLGMQAAAVVLWIPMFVGFWGDASAISLMKYLLLYLVLCAVHRLHGLWRWRRGEVLHSYYSGRPHLMRLQRLIHERTVKRIVEPVMVLVAGGILFCMSQGCGAYFLGAGICLLIKAQLERQQEELILMDIRDAYFTQRFLRERLWSF